MTTELAKARDLLDSGDPQGAMRTLRHAADSLAPADCAPVLRRLAEGAGFEDLAEASAAVAAHADRPDALYAYGYACIERGVSDLAVPALREALRLALAPRRGGLFRRAPETRTAPQQILLELAVALEDEQRHAAAVELLTEHDGLLTDWPGRYLLVHNALMDGRLDTAGRVFAGLGEPSETWRPAADRVRRVLRRSADATPADRRDLRGWHYTLTGGLLATLSPYGFADGMTGRWAFYQDGFDACRRGLDRLAAVLEATGRRPASVALLPDRGSRALGLAAARLLGLPAAPYRPGTPDTLVVAYDLNACEPEVLSALRDRADGEVLFEHATCWTDTPAVSADVCTLLVQHVVAPWEPSLRIGDSGEPERTPADDRTAEELAEEICAAEPEPDEGDGATPADPDELLAAFAARVRGSWLTGPRDRVRSAGPVPSSKFA
ncbi:hypothetical protein AB0442_03025 [Kitasatospora sp. NPDC085895]|uniref:hypothetical protein n=1 Tax=Kitasatospora sp. NPDC085895 TaxID=3155057 RepID=UPI00344FC58B